MVTQVEMNNAEARAELRRMLEYQIREKEHLREQDASQREKIYQHSVIMQDQQQLKRDIDNQKMQQLIEQ